MMVSRIRRTLTVQERAAAYEHTNRIAMEPAEEERRRREEKNERLRKLRLAAHSSEKKDPRLPPVGIPPDLAIRRSDDERQA